MFDDPNDVVYLKDLKKDLNKQCKMSWLPVCHVKQRGNRNAIDSIERKTGVIVGLHNFNSYNRNRNPNRKIFMTIHISDINNIT